MSDDIKRLRAIEAGMTAAPWVEAELPGYRPADEVGVVAMRNLWALMVDAVEAGDESRLRDGHELCDVDEDCAICAICAYDAARARLTEAIGKLP